MNNKKVQEIEKLMKPISEELHSLRSVTMKYSRREAELDKRYNELQKQLQELLGV